MASKSNERRRCKVDSASLRHFQRDHYPGHSTALLEWVGAQAHAAGKSVTVAVEKDNRAQTLYRRLGFREIGDHGVHWDMEWNAAADQRTNVI